MSNFTTKARSPSFFDLYCKGDASADDIDDFVAKWHARKDARARALPLHDYLGLTRDEYEAWVRDAGALPRIRRARKS
jgi:hypothetical protein